MEQLPDSNILSDEHAIYDALIDVQVAAVEPDMATLKAQVYGEQRGRSDDYTQMGLGTTAERMRFDLEVWFPLVEKLREQGVVSSATEMRDLAHGMMGKTPAEFLAWFAEQTITTRQRLADLQTR